MSMRLTRTFILPIAIISVCLALTGACYGSTVTVDMAAKTSASDTNTLEPSKPRIKGDQVGLQVKSTIIEPQFVTIKFVGLKDQVYDVYVNNEFKGPRPAKDFEVGVQYRIDGRVTDPDMMRCLAALKQPIADASARLGKSEDTEAKRICWTLNQAAGWVSSGLSRDQAWRSVSIVLAPTGTMLNSMAFMTREDAYGTARAVTTACWLLQQARDRMNDVIKNPTLRNDAVVALTPVEFTTTYSTRNGKPHIDAKVTNNCDLPIAGDVSFALPKGWKTNAKNLKFADLKSGTVFTASFDLIGPAKTAPPDSVPIAANVTVTRDDMSASLKLKTNALMQATMPAK